MQPSQATASPNTRSFAGLLADFAAQEKKFPPVRDEDGLADDVATLTYEHALRAHARYRPAADPPLNLAEQRADAPRHETSAAQSGRRPCPSPQSPGVRKNSSVTVRLTHEEDVQLRQRAAEAGLTVSAYLRSCAFEVEALRSQVKQTLAELRSAQITATSDSGWRRILPWARKAT
jgi:hypothetical protein